MNNQKFYAVQAITNSGEKFLCWKEKKHFYFAKKKRGFKNPNPPTLFMTRSECAKALSEIPKSGGNVKQFAHVMNVKKSRIVAVSVSLTGKK